MRFNLDTFTVALLLVSNTPSLAHPQPVTDITLISREDAAPLDARNNEPFADVRDLWKRKGGGGGGGKGGGGGGGGKGGSGSSSGKGGSSSSGSSSSGYVLTPPKGSGSDSSSGRVATQKNQRTRDASSTSRSSGSGSGVVETRKERDDNSLLSRFFPVIFTGFVPPKPKSDGKSSSSSSSSGKGSSSSSTGGSTKTGSGVTPNYGGGRYYGGGAATPYQSGVRSPLGITPVFLGVGALAFFPGIWLFGAYNYPYTHPYTFYNRTAPTNTTNTTEALVTRQTTIDTGANETKPVTCLCAAYQECGCDDNGNTTFLNSLIGDGTYSSLNQTLVTVADVNGTSTIIINGTLPNGTTSSGGTEDAFSAGARTIVEASGHLVMIALVGCTVFLA
jgi:hypothetical protein